MIGEFRVAVVVPAYRVAPHIAGVLGAMPPCVDIILVVNDASPDETAEIVGSWPDSRVRQVQHIENQGVGGAMASGFRAALSEGADIVVKCDGDGQMDPLQIPGLIAPIVGGRADYTKGCRFHHSAELRAMPRARFVGNVGLTFLTKLASGYWHVLDPQNGFVAIRSEHLRRISLEDLSRGYFFENDMLIRLNCIEARVLDVAMPARYGEEQSSLNPWRILVSFPVRLFAGFFRRLFWRYLFFDVSPVAVFFLAGLALALFGAIFGSLHWIENARVGRETPTGTVILAAVPFILGVQLLLQALVLDIQNTPRPAGREQSPISPDPPPRDVSGPPVR